MPEFEVESEFAILDVKDGRQELEHHFKDRPRSGKCPESLRIPVTVTGYIDGVWGGDDGVSQEFSVIVEGIKVGADA